MSKYGLPYKHSSTQKYANIAKNWGFAGIKFTGRFFVDATLTIGFPGCNNFVVKNCDFSAEQASLHLETYYDPTNIIDNLVVDHCLFGKGDPADTFWGNSVFTYATINNATIKNCFFKEANYNAIQLQSENKDSELGIMKSLTVENNIFYRTKSRVINALCGTGTVSITIKDNIIIDCNTDADRFEQIFAIASWPFGLITEAMYNNAVLTNNSWNGMQKDNEVYWAYDKYSDGDRVIHAYKPLYITSGAGTNCSVANSDITIANASIESITPAVKVYPVADGVTFTITENGVEVPNVTIPIGGGVMTIPAGTLKDTEEHIWEIKSSNGKQMLVGVKATAL